MYAFWKLKSDFCWKDNFLSSWLGKQGSWESYSICQICIFGRYTGSSVWSPTHNCVTACSAPWSYSPVINSNTSRRSSSPSSTLVSRSMASRAPWICSSTRRQHRATRNWSPTVRSRYMLSKAVSTLIEHSTWAWHSISNTQDPTSNEITLNHFTCSLIEHFRRLRRVEPLSFVILSSRLVR